MKTILFLDHNSFVKYKIMKLKIILPIIAGILAVVFLNGCKKDKDEVIRPSVFSTAPLKDEYNIARNEVISVTFSEAMNPATITTTSFTLKQGDTEISGVVEYSGLIATFTPIGTLTASHIYTAKITTSVESMTGNSLALDYEWNFTTGGSSIGVTNVNLGTAGNYVILAKTAINNSSNTAVTGDVGLSPAATSYITGMALTDFTGYATSSQLTGRVFAADMADPTPINLTTAVENMITAYNDAEGRPSPDFLELATGNIGGLTLTPGLYKWTSTITIPTDVTITGSATDVWIFQIAGDLIMNSAAKIILSGGAKAENITWQVAGQVTCGTVSKFEGIILSKTAITFQTGASINGRALAQSSVILDANTVKLP